METSGATGSSDPAAAVYARAMLRLARPLLALLAGLSLVVVASGLLHTLVSLRMHHEHFGGLAIGLVLGGYYVGYTLGAGALPLAVARVGHVRVFAAMAATVSLVALGLPLLPHVPAWIALRMLAGLGMAGLYMVVESWLNAHTASSSRGAVLALYMVVSQLSLVAGQALVPLYPVERLEPFAIAAALVALGVVPIALARSAQPALPSRQRLGLLRLARRSPLGVLGTAASGLVGGALLGLGPLFVAGLGGDRGEVSAFMAAVVGGGLVLQWPLGRLSDRIGRAPVILGVGLALAVLGAATASLGRAHLGLLLLAGGGVGACAYVLYPLSLARANDVIDPSEMVAASGSLLLAYGLGAALGPLAGSAAMAWLGPGGAFWWVAAVGLVLGGATLGVALKRPRVPRGERGAFRGGSQRL